MQRRRFLRGIAGVGGVAVTGCLGDGVTVDGGRSNPGVLEDRPDRVYRPTHVEGMVMAGMADAGPYRVAMSYSFPHRFWLLTGDRRRRVDVRDRDSVHLMTVIWDGETGIVPPNANVDVTVSREGEVVAEKSLWPMLSQNMGLHAGDNVALDGAGRYDAEVTVGPIDDRLTGDLRRRMGEREQGSITVDFAPSDLDGVTVERFGDTAGDPDAVEAMAMDGMPVAELPAPEDLPGRTLGTATIDDASFVATVLEEPPAGADTGSGDGDRAPGRASYLAVSPRTPYNRYPLPFMTLSTTIRRDGTLVHEGSLTPTLHQDLGHHYGAVTGSVEAGDELTVTVDAPPQLARHEGYETAFLSMDEATITAE